MFFTLLGPAFKTIRKQSTAMLLLAAAAFASEPHAELGFQHFYNLEFDQAIGEFRLEIAEAPAEADGYNHLAQAILLRRLYESGILENSLVSGGDALFSLVHQPKLVLLPTEEAEFRRAIASSTKSARARLLTNPIDDAALYSLGVAYSLSANYEFLVRKAWLPAMRAGNQALKLHERVAELNPSKTDALLIVGIHNYVVASLPSGLRFLGAMAGLRGDKRKGLEALRTVAERGRQNRTEAQMLLSVLYRHEKRTEQAIPLLNELIQSSPRNYLLHFAKVYAFIELRDGPKALESLRWLDMNRTAGELGYGRILPRQICRTRDQIESRLGSRDKAMDRSEKRTGIVGCKDRNSRSCG